MLVLLVVRSACWVALAGPGRVTRHFVTLHTRRALHTAHRKRVRGGWARGKMTMKMMPRAMKEMGMGMNGDGVDVTDWRWLCSGYYLLYGIFTRYLQSFYSNYYPILR